MFLRSVLVLLIVHHASMASPGNQFLSPDRPRQNFSRCPGAWPPPARPTPGPVFFGPHQRTAFVPYKILYVLDPDISDTNKARILKAAKFVNDRLSKFMQAPFLDDVRFHYTSLCKDPNQNPPECYQICVDKVPSEYRKPCGCNNPKDQKTNKVEQQNKEQYTLVMIVILNGEGVGPEECGPGTLAIGGACEFESEDGRVTHGKMKYCESLATKTDDVLNEVTLHETLHAILPTLVAVTDKASGCNAPRQANLVDEAKLCVGTLYDEIEYDWMDENGHVSRRKRYVVKNSRVRDAARDHYGCPTVQGAELQYFFDGNGEQQPDFAHWSEDLYPDELMTPLTQGFYGLSALTLAAIASHSSHYKVDMSYAEKLRSKPSPHLACEVAHKSCYRILHEQRQTPGVKSVVPFCYNPNAAIPMSYCSNDHKFHMSCEKFKECPILVAPVVGAIPNYYDHQQCEKATTTPPGGNSMPEIIGNAVGQGSICVTFTEHPALPTLTFPACVIHECRLDKRIIVLKLRPKAATGDECFIECTQGQSNQKVTFQKPPQCVFNFPNPYSVICPDYATVCGLPPTTKAPTTPTTAAKTAIPGPAPPQPPPVGTGSTQGTATGQTVGTIPDDTTTGSVSMPTASLVNMVGAGLMFFAQAVASDFM